MPCHSAGDTTIQYFDTLFCGDGQFRDSPDVTVANDFPVDLARKAADSFWERRFESDHAHLMVR